MTRSVEQIVSLYRRRKSELGPVRAKAAEISQVYDGVVTIGLPELDESKAPAIANWLTQGLDQMAMRVASVTPQIICPPLRAGFKGSEDNARTRRRALTAWWQENALDLQLSKRARWFIGYASAPVVITPDLKRHIPRWEERDPLATYPAPMRSTEMCPSDCIFAYQRPLAWIQENHPAAARALEPSRSASPDRMFELLEYVDAEEHVLIALGNAEPTRPRGFELVGGRSAPAPAHIELSRFPNRVGRCTVVIPKRLSLNESRGHFDQLPSLYRMQARVMALWLIATERAIFPDTWFVSRPNETVTVLQEPDGRAGIVGQVKGGDLKEMAAVAAPQVAEIIQMLERNQMTTASIPSDFGGEPNSAVRTGRAMESSLSTTLDQWLAEAHKAFGYALREENKLAIAIAKEYFGDEPQTFWVSFNKVHGDATYTPNKDFDTDANIVAWPHAGSDAGQLIIGIGQRMGLGEMSKRTARILDPYIDDPDLEEDRCTAEAMEQVMTQSIAQAVMQGQIGPLEVGQIAALVSEERQTIYEAYNTVHQRIQKQAMAAQAQQQQQAAGGGMNGQGPPGAGGPAGQPPGLMNPNVAAQLGLPAGGTPPAGGVPSPAPSVDHMAQLMSALRPRSLSPPGQH
jgi:hypothetical protein